MKVIINTLILFFMLNNPIDLTASGSNSFPEKVEAIILDCDGILVDTEYLKFQAWQNALSTINIDLSIEEYKILAGHSSKNICKLLQKMKNTPIPEKIIELKRKIYQELQAQGVPSIKEMVTFAHYLAQHKNVLGIKLGLASSASRKEIFTNLQQIGLENSFDLVISGSDDLDDYHDDQGKNKPKPYIYLEASKRLKISPERCLVFEDTESGVEAAVNAGMVAIAIPNWVTKDHDFSKANQILNSISEFSTENFNVIPFNIDEELEKNPLTSAQQCLQIFLQKGGAFRNIPDLSDSSEVLTRLNIGDAVYPICSGGWCRSQALWAILKPYSDQIILFPPHAARVGWDPYNGQINRCRNYAQEEVYDEFSSYFGMEKSLRFGFENSPEWEFIEKSPTNEGLQAITQFYDEHYFGPNSSWQGMQGRRKIYVAFSNNVHVTLYRLIQVNESLKDVLVIAIHSDDLITYPPSFLNTTSRSAKAYEYFSNLLKQHFNCIGL